jgi:hypothetical protein
MYTKASKGVTIPKTYVAFILDPLDELKEQYDASLNQGIVTPSNKLDPSPTNNPPKLKLTY